MDQYYCEWMASTEANNYFENHGGTVPVCKRRQLLTQWAGRAYRTLEEERQRCEVAGERSLFYKAFLRTGCLVTRDGTGDDEIHPHAEINGDLYTRFRGMLLPPPEEKDQEFVINLSEHEDPDCESEEDVGEGSSGEDNEGMISGESDTEDEDDDPPEGSDDDSEREPVPDELEIEVPSEEELIRQARGAAGAAGERELNDFRFAERIARESGYAERSYSRAVLPEDAPPGVRRSKRKRNVLI